MSPEKEKGQCIIDVAVGFFGSNDEIKNIEENKDHGRLVLTNGFFNKKCGMYMSRLRPVSFCAPDPKYLQGGPCARGKLIGIRDNPATRPFWWKRKYQLLNNHRYNGSSSGIYFYVTPSLAYVNLLHFNVNYSPKFYKRVINYSNPSNDHWDRRKPDWLYYLNNIYDKYVDYKAEEPLNVPNNLKRTLFQNYDRKLNGECAGESLWALFGVSRFVIKNMNPTSLLKLKRGKVYSESNPPPILRYCPTLPIHICDTAAWENGGLTFCATYEEEPAPFFVLGLSR